MAEIQMDLGLAVKIRRKKFIEIYIKKRYNREPTEEELNLITDAILTGMDIGIRWMALHEITIGAEPIVLEEEEETSEPSELIPTDEEKKPTPMPPPPRKPITDGE